MSAVAIEWSHPDQSEEIFWRLMLSQFRELRRSEVVAVTSPTPGALCSNFRFAVSRSSFDLTKPSDLSASILLNFLLESWSTMCCYTLLRTTFEVTVRKAILFGGTCKAISCRRRVTLVRSSSSCFSWCLRDSSRPHMAVRSER